MGKSRRTQIIQTIIAAVIVLIIWNLADDVDDLETRLVVNGMVLVVGVVVNWLKYFKYWKDE